VLHLFDVKSHPCMMLQDFTDHFYKSVTRLISKRRNRSKRTIANSFESLQSDLTVELSEGRFRPVTLARIIIGARVAQESARGRRNGREKAIVVDFFRSSIIAQRATAIGRTSGCSCDATRSIGHRTSVRKSLASLMPVERDDL